MEAVIQPNTIKSSTKFYVEGRGFIFPKHKEAIESVGGQIVGEMKNADWVVILTPNYLHFDMIIKAVNVGKDVLCEKPLVLSPGLCKILRDVERVQGRRIFSVAQLRYLPVLKEIPKKDYNEIEIFVEVYRDKKYFKSWKGSQDQSGGILYNLGVHYFDLVIHLFGEPIEAHWTWVGDDENSGHFRGENYICRYTFSYKAERDKQRRAFRINGIEYDLAAKENLHRYVYQDLLKGVGIRPEEALKTIQLIEKLK